MQERIVAAYSETSKELNILYEKRKRTLFFQRVMWGITGIYLLFMLALLGMQYVPKFQNASWGLFDVFKATPTNPYASTYPIIGLVILLYPITIIFTRAFQKFKQREKETLAKMVKMLFPKVEFTQGAAPPIKEIIHSKFFVWAKKDTPMYSFGQIRGRTHNGIISIADIGIVEKNMSNKVTGGLMGIPTLNILVVFYEYVFKNIVSNTSADNQYFTYRGMFCWLHFKKKLNGHTVILSNDPLTKWDRLASFSFRDEHKIHLEDPRFTKNFMVYGTDQVEARYVLSSSLMERIVALREKFARPLFLSFQDKQLYLAVMNDNGLFSFSLGKLEGIKIVEELASDIETALEIPDELKL